MAGRAQRQGPRAPRTTTKSRRGCPDSSGALLFEETNALTAQVVAAGVGADHNHIKQWFHDSDTKPANEEYSKPIGAGELSPAMDRLAMLRGGTHIGNGGLAHGHGQHDRAYGVHLPSRR